jgi:hypothetical protein
MFVTLSFHETLIFQLRVLKFSIDFKKYKTVEFCDDAM